MHNSKYSLTVEKAAKKFGRQLLFKNISFSLNTGDSFYITGPNGSGKSTLLQITAGIQRASAGSVTLALGDDVIPAEERLLHCGFTGPAINPYDMLTAAENIGFASRDADPERAGEMLRMFDLYRHRDKYVGVYSSGMKQRLKLILAMINSPGILMLDEPGSNLDSAGKSLLSTALEEIRNKTILILATNERDEINLCAKGIDLAEQNN